MLKMSSSKMVELINKMYGFSRLTRMLLMWMYFILMIFYIFIIIPIEEIKKGVITIFRNIKYRIMDMSYISKRAKKNFPAKFGEIRCALYGFDYKNYKKNA